MLAGTACVLAGVTLCAQERGRFAFGGIMIPPGFQALDLNQDRAISAEEIAKAGDSLKKLDQNGDGKLSADEVRPHFEGRGEGRGRGGRGGDGPGEASGPSADDLVNTLMAFDKNGDKKLSKEEVPERMQGLFARADADHDGVLTADEIRKSAQSTSAPAGGGEREGRVEGRGGRGGEPPNFMKIDPIFAAVDADGDGEISAAELANAPAALKKLDKNGDGQITPDEVPMMGGRGRGGR
jgi:Ca2+-binding EF-hand superfamily protein